MPTLTSIHTRHSERSEAPFSIARFSCDESRFLGSLFSETSDYQLPTNSPSYCAEPVGCKLTPLKS